MFYTHSNKVSCRSGEPQTVCTCGKAGRQRSQVICLNRHHSIDKLHAAQSTHLPTLRIIRPCPAKRAIHSTSARPRRGRVPSVPPATFRQTGCRWRGQSARLGCSRQNSARSRPRAAVKRPPTRKWRRPAAGFSNILPATPIRRCGVADWCESRRASPRWQKYRRLPSGGRLPRRTRQRIRQRRASRTRRRDVVCHPGRRVALRRAAFPNVEAQPPRPTTET